MNVMRIWNLFRKKEHVEPRIFECPIDDDVKIMGQVFHGLQDIRKHVELSLLENSSIGPQECEPERKGKVHVGELWMSYPCFDSSDYMYENRTYQNYIFRGRHVTYSDLKRLEALPTHGNSKRIAPTVPQEMLPMVYYVCEGNTMMVAV